jgi:hypothetical protein
VQIIINFSVLCQLTLGYTSYEMTHVGIDLSGDACDFDKVKKWIGKARVLRPSQNGVGAE